MLLSVNAGSDKCGFTTTLRQQRMWVFYVIYRQICIPNACEKRTNITQTLILKDRKQNQKNHNQKIFNLQIHQAFLWTFTKVHSPSLPNLI